MEENNTVVRMPKLPACDFCAMQGKTVDARYDGRTTAGQWAYMCNAHYSKHGMGLGLGVGQYLKLPNE